MSFGGLIGSLPQLLGMIEGASAGTLPVILAQVENAGFSDRVQSWLGRGENLPVTAAELEMALTPEQLSAWAEHSGTTREAVLQAMVVHLPDAAATTRRSNGPDQPAVA